MLSVVGGQPFLSPGIVHLGKIAGGFMLVGLLAGRLLDSGMSQGAALAFMIAGAGTSIGAITGALTIARWRVVALVEGFLWAGAISSGLAFNLAMG